MPSPFNIAPLHIGKVIPPPYAGIEAHIDSLLRCLRNDVAATLVATRGTSDNVPLNAEAPYRVIPVRTFGKLASVQLSPGIQRAVTAEFAAGRANLLHLHAPNPWGDLAALTARRDVPVVMTWHSDVIRQKRLMLAYAQVQRRAIDRADRVIIFTPNHFKSSRQLQVPGIEQKLAYIPLGIDFEPIDRHVPDQEMLGEVDRWSEGRPLILTVGRHVYYKGYEHLIDALAVSSTEAVLVMVGTGPLSAQLKARAEERGVGSRVRMVGEVGNAALYSLFHRCDLFTLPSIEQSEAFGIATAEAMGCGKPTVVCELQNGVNYLTRHGETGFAVAPRDSDALARALDELVRNDSLRHAMGRAAREWVRSEFSIAKMRSGTLALYRELR